MMTRAFAIPLCVLLLLLSSPRQVAAAGSENAPLEEQVERAARSYRLQIYATFRSNRAEYDRRAAQAEQILKEWRQRGSSASEVPSLVDWFRGATRASELSPSLSLPEYRPLADPDPVTQIPTAPVPTPDAPAAPLESPELPLPSIKPPERPTDIIQFAPQTLPPSRLNRERRLPEIQVPKAVVTPSLPGENPQQTQRPAGDSSSPVDLAVLGSRIRSYNLTLAEIETELSQPGPWPVERLTTVIDQIERLFGRRHLSQIYYDALTPQQRQRVQNFASVDLTLALLDQRLFEAQVALMDANLELDPVFGQHELSQIRSLSEKVRNWTVFRD